MSPAPSQRSQPPSLLYLPPEIHHYLLPFLSLSSLPSVALTCRLFHRLVSQDAFRQHALSLSYDPLTIAHAHTSWSWSRKAHWSYDVSARWDKWECGGEMLGGGKQWERKCMPVIRLWRQEGGRGRVVIGRGAVLELWEVDEQGRRRELLAEQEGRSKAVRSGAEDITGIATVEGAPNDLVLSRVSGLVQRVKFEAGTQSYGARMVENARYVSPGRVPSLVQAIHSLGNTLATATTHRPRPAPHTSISLPTSRAKHTHTISLHSLSSPWTPPTSFALYTKPWSLLLFPSLLAIGHSGPTPLSLYSLTPSGPLPTPRQLTGNPRSTSIYALASPSSSSTAFRADTILAAGFYDATVRMYDLRSAESEPVLTLADPFSDDPTYSLALGGPGGSYVLAGSARNACVRVFDVRKPGEGLTAFAPGKERSPVYGLQVETGRVWGVTERRGFVMGFEGRGERVGSYGHEKGEVRLGEGAALARWR